ncbi:AP2 domain-containing protein [Massilia antarctica]|uniref:AP2 domain-containing protein n=1 Tax=Massilia antarctica TaxID=2765360 RepID=A0AA48WA89_9BURK|nr:AP2/ERF family transcription factor [Massilia antarctica]QPI48870.1 AP2 domain-containing protein [Massilia antarctica]
MSNDKPVQKSRHAPEQIGIYRILHPVLGRYYQQVTLHRNGEQFDKRFFEADCGGEQQALRVAQAWRDRIIEQHPPMTLAKFCTIVRKNNTSGVPGVSRTIKRHRNQQGAVKERIYWVARTPMPGGTSPARSFSVKTFGEDEAKRLAVAARMADLSELERTIFRSELQPQPVSNAEAMSFLDRELGRPAERKAERAERQALKAEHNRVRAQAVQAKVHRLQEAQLASLRAPTNSTGEPYIGRSSRVGEIAGYWRVSIERKGKKYRKTFSDGVYGSTAAALAAAQTWRDQLFQSMPPSNKAAVAARINSTNTSGIAGVHLAKAGPDKTPASWVAMKPKSKGQPSRLKRFSIAKYGHEEAFALAVQARLAFVAELAQTPHFQHRAAQQLDHIMSRKTAR